MIIIFVALGLFVIGLLTGEPDMAIPACIVGGIGGILYFQAIGVLTWQSWAYMWTLIPGFVGLGLLIAGLLNWKRKQIGEGLESLLTSAVRDNPPPSQRACDAQFRAGGNSPTEPQNERKRRRGDGAWQTLCLEFWLPSRRRARP